MVELINHCRIAKGKGYYLICNVITGSTLELDEKSFTIYSFIKNGSGSKSDNDIYEFAEKVGVKKESLRDYLQFLQDEKVIQILL